MFATVGVTSLHRFRDLRRVLDQLLDITSALPAIAISFGISFLRDLVIAGQLSDSPLANAYSILAAVQAALVGIATGTINASLPPQFAKNPSHQQALLRAALVRASFLSLVISAACLTATTALLWRSTFTAHLSSVDLTAGCLLFSMSIPLLAIGAVFAVRLNSSRRLVLASLPTICSAAGVLIAAEASSGSLTLLGCGLLIGALSGLALTWLASSSQPYQTVQQAPEPASLRDAFRSVPDTALAMALASAGSFVDSLILATLLPASIAAYSYASRIPIGLQAIVSVIASARIIHIFSELLPRKGIRSTFRYCIVLYTFTIFGSALLAILISWGSTSIIRTLFERGRFGSELAATVAHIQAVLIWYLPGALATQVLNQFMWALGRNRWLMWLSATLLLLKLIVAAPATHLFGIAGMAWGQVAIFWAIALLALVVAALYARDAGAPATVG